VNGRVKEIAMKRTATRLIVLLSLLLALAPDSTSSTPALSAAPASAGYGQNELAARIKRIEEGLVPAKAEPGAPPATIQDRMLFYKVPGVSVAVINDFKVEWAKGYGVLDVETREAVRVSSLFQAASISKPVAALGALKLVQDGKIDLNADVNASLKSWKLPDNEFTALGKVTLKHLLSHTGGLTVHGFPGYPVPGPVPTLIMVLNGERPANTAPIRVDTAPGRMYRYSGGGYVIVQQMILDVGGRPFPEFMKDTVLSPLGMWDSTYEQPLPPDKLKSAAAGHRADGNLVPGKRHTYPEMSAAGLWTTPTDLAIFAIEIQKSALGKSNKVLGRAMVDLMLTPVKENYGLGLGIDLNGAYFQHNGGNEGFRCLLYSSRQGGYGLAVMTNSDSGNPLYQEILKSVAREYKWAGFESR
jgi:CubicO group peptidase (beta-lactamase class C family)